MAKYNDVGTFCDVVFVTVTETIDLFEVAIDPSDCFLTILKVSIFLEFTRYWVNCGVDGKDKFWWMIILFVGSSSASGPSN